LKIFDTTFLIDLVNGDEDAVKKAKEVDKESTFKSISVVTVHEYLRGIFSHDENLLKIKLDRAEAELIRFEILPYTYEIAKKAAEILARNGTTISFDLIALHYIST
jgi:tRNA(fMet)-specific endonuclease VapC